VPPKSANGVGPDKAEAADKERAEKVEKEKVSKADKDKKDATKKSARRSRDSLESEAKVSPSAADTARQNAIDPKTAGRLLSSETETAAVDVPQIGLRRSASHDPTFVSHVSDLVDRESASSIDEWDASPTQNLVGDDFPSFGDRKTAVALPATDFKSTLQSLSRPGGSGSGLGGGSSGATGGTSPPATIAGGVAAHAPLGLGPLNTTPGVRPGPIERHDPAITTSQAVRVVVWRDASGVHVAPAGTVVSAITVDAVLVALEPHADLTAWLSARDARELRGR
jgi:hypothetical protein